MAILKGSDLKNSACDVVLEFLKHAPFESGLDFAIAPAPCQHASHLDYGETTDRQRRNRLKEVVQRV